MIRLTFSNNLGGIIQGQKVKHLSICRIEAPKFGHFSTAILFKVVEK